MAKIRFTLVNGEFLKTVDDAEKAIEEFKGAGSQQWVQADGGAWLKREAVVAVEPVAPASSGPSVK